MKNVSGALSLVIKILAIVAMIAVGLLIYQMCSGTPLIQRIDKTLPDVSAVPFQVTTQTHSYLAQKATLNDDKSVTMAGWYEQIEGRWIYHKEPLRLPSVLKPRISRR